MSFILQGTSKLQNECRTHLNDCLALEASRQEVLINVEKKLHGITQAEENINKSKLDLMKERKRLMNTRNSILCSACQQPLADRYEMKKHGLTNLGLRTAGDGEHNFFEVSMNLNSYRCLANY